MVGAWKHNTYVRGNTAKPLIFQDKHSLIPKFPDLCSHNLCFGISYVFRIITEFPRNVFETNQTINTYEKMNINDFTEGEDR